MAEIRGIEVELKQPFNFVRETLERIGIINRGKRTLYPSCYILQKKGKYYIIHFKNLFLLDGKQSNYSLEDDLRQTAICNKLVEWDLVKIVDDTNVVKDRELPSPFVLPYNEKDTWIIQHKYNIGSFKKE